MGLLLALHLVSALALQHKDPCLNPNTAHYAWSFHVLPVYVRVLSRHPGFLQQAKNMQHRLIGSQQKAQRLAARRNM